MPDQIVQQYDELRKELNAIASPAPLPVFWTVAEDDLQRQQPRFILDSGDASRPDKDSPVTAGFPFADTDNIDFRDGLREGFVDWLTNDENPLFARVAVNRIWHWHFGQGLHRKPSDFGALGESPIHPELLDWLASEFIANDYSMKWLHRVIVTSDAYRRTSAGSLVKEPGSHTASHESPRGNSVNQKIDPNNRLFWKFPIRRLAAESIWDAIHFAANDLDESVGGPSFSPKSEEGFYASKKRRAAYMRRGFRPGNDVMPEFLRVFDVEDGRAVCPIRQQSVTAPQGLLLLNAPVVEHASEKVSKRIEQQSHGDLSASVTLAYRLTLCRPPTETEAAAAIQYIDGNAGRLKHFCWLMFNLDEFIYVR